ncbi:vacuolar protein sorting-associated protein 25 isoform X1 [Phalaenopsis equestris]|uniref:vacuolar protein sorting-associated protein 25 isoform X1 n=1 Tax=Phalaenopsis equestris TaxID=78828 RepID=UPI0009E4DB52|nr:vacuolar protein sorting-associated protein 25 isoform X1 [Phalaenopsis equestris]
MFSRKFFPNSRKFFPNSLLPSFAQNYLRRDHAVRIQLRLEKTGKPNDRIPVNRDTKFLSVSSFRSVPTERTYGALVLWKICGMIRCRSWGILNYLNSSTIHHISRSLSHESRELFLSALVSEGRAEWMDKSHKKCLILWLRIPDWADYIINFVKQNGLEDSVMTVEDIRTGIESRGTELAGIDRVVLMRALKLLEQKGKAAIFKGSSTDDEGVKFNV